MNRIERIKKKLDILNPNFLEIIDESKFHSNHYSDGNERETHLALKISSDLLNEKTLILQHRIINNLLSDEFDSGLHALKINTKS